MKIRIIISKGGININVKGISRKFDNLGRIVIPIEYRKELNIKNYDSMELLLTDDCIIIKPQKGCKLCKNPEDLLTFKDNLLCMDCVRQIKEKNL